MTALFIFLAVLVLVHGLALGAYISIYKIKCETIFTKTASTLVLGAAYTVLVALITTIVIMPPIS